MKRTWTGIDIHCAAAATIYPHLNNSTELAPLMQSLVKNGDHGVKSASRKGFYDWDEAAVARAQKRYQIALTKAMQILRDEEDAQQEDAR